MMISIVVSLAVGNIVTLDATTETLEVTTSAAVNTDYTISYTNNASGTITPGSSHGQITTATTTTVLSAPAASEQRAVTAVSICNVGTAAQTIIVKHDTSGTERVVARASLAASECMVASNDGRWTALNSAGSPKTSNTPRTLGGRSYVWSKSATAVDTIGYHYIYGKDTGFPGAYSLGTPGLNGVATDCSVAGTAGSGGALSLGAPVFSNAGSGSLYLKSWQVTGAVVGTYALIDVLWYNTGIAVTTTTAQAITTPAFPARDANGSSNGADINLALMTTTANTNAAVITNTTASYTDAEGNAGATAAQFALVGFQTVATPVIGTWTPLYLAAGDTGVRAVASITLGTSYGAGALSLVAYRVLAVAGVSVANNTTVTVPSISPRVYNGSCLMVVALGAPAVTAPAITAAVAQIEEW